MGDNMARYPQKQQLGGQKSNTRIQRETYPNWNAGKVIPQRPVYRCPICNSPQIRSLSSVYGRGVYTSVSRRGRLFKRGYTTKTSKSLLADKCAPPEKRRYAIGVLLVAMAIAVVFVPLGPLQQLIPPQDLDVAAMVCGWLGVYLFARAWWWNSRTFPRLSDKWQRSQLCERCGTISTV
jgi:hypothetical protein